MSVMAAIARRARAPQRTPALLLTRRCLGDTVAGPPVTDFAANLKIASEFFTKSPVSYAEFKQQCVSLRIFVFAALNAGIALALFLDPPKSSYWARMSPLYLFSYVKSSLWSSSPPIFLTEKVEHSADVPDIVKQLTATRRLLTDGSDSEEE
eukprot:CAMPEP_0175370342 /NCGR_PEP_ID=MMETSP0095-20121207/21158_1 /TAXON_ID=311494 /ORGANISM="Alexandrium monilatum, Strain CCMP3105" /LENGTH=151 /DNA_ID=CAMNT_0016668487 /DNA_START=68 /DNA_END=523 /DNA_ORIENTATION=-